MSPAIGPANDIDLIKPQENDENSASHSLDAAECRLVPAKASQSWPADFPSPKNLKNVTFSADYDFFFP
jgi:hypothetical protein